MKFDVIVWEEMSAEGDFFDTMHLVFAGTEFEVDLDFSEFISPGSPWLNFSEEFLTEVDRMGFSGAFLPRGYGNADTAFYALDMRYFYDSDMIRVALVDDSE